MASCRTASIFPAAIRPSYCSGRVFLIYLPPHDFKVSSEMPCASIRRFPTYPIEFVPSSTEAAIVNAGFLRRRSSYVLYQLGMN